MRSELLVELARGDLGDNQDRDDRDGLALVPVRTGEPSVVAEAAALAQRAGDRSRFPRCPGGGSGRGSRSLTGAASSAGARRARAGTHSTAARPRPCSTSHMGQRRARLGRDRAAARRPARARGPAGRELHPRRRLLDPERRAAGDRRRRRALARAPAVDRYRRSHSAPPASRSCSGRVADLFGRRRLFLAGMALLGVSSLAGGLAASPQVLLAARAAQGLATAARHPGGVVAAHHRVRRRSAARARARAQRRADGRRVHDRRDRSAAC